MDRKSIIILAVCFVALMAWFPLVNKLYPPKPLPPGATNALALAQAAARTNPPAVVTTNAPSAPPTLTAAPKQLVALADAPEELVVVTNDNARYTFTSHGGGLKLVELVQYPETVSRRREKGPLTNGVATLNTRVSVPVLAVFGDDSVQGDGVFTLTKTAAGVRAEKTLTNGLRLIKEFQPTTNYLVVATVRLENTSSQPLSLPAQEWTVGTATPMGPDDKNAVQNVGLMWYDGKKSQEVGQSWFDNRTLGCVPGVPRTEYRNGESNVVWAAVHNQFFALAAMPKEPALQVVVRPVELPRSADEQPPANARPMLPPKGLQAALVYPATKLAAGQTIERQIYFFGGPKEYKTLARIANRFQNNVDLVMGFGGFFGFFAKALLLSMNGLQQLLHVGYGWVIIAITVIIKLLFWPLTQASTRSMKRMQALQPQMKALQEKYKDDPTKMNKKLMEFMKENKVSPLGGCLPMLLQMPVFIGFFYMIRSAIELRGARFLWVSDLSKPDTMFMIPGLDFPFNPLPLVMGVTMLWQARMTPPSPGMDPTQQKIMKYMPLIFLFMLYNFSAGLTLYWTVQNLLTIAQMKLTKAQQDPLAAAKAPVNVAPQKKKK
jgi:YidC/Oxa1 family membrane protein insertase